MDSCDQQGAGSFVMPPCDNSPGDTVTDWSYLELSLVDPFQEQVDPIQEQVDPDPEVDLQLLFNHLNHKFFWGFLDEVHVAWSPRLKTKAGGYCQFDPDTRKCVIRLNQSGFRSGPRSDLVGALLHEMIHAILCIFDDQDDSEHGTKFRRHVDRIYEKSGGNIQVPLHWDVSVDEMRQHWWQCSGQCQGYIKRAINRPPSCRESWWAQHQSVCGGTFIKVREPEKSSKKGKRKRKASTSSDHTLHVEEEDQEPQHSKRRREADDI